MELSCGSAGDAAEKKHAHLDPLKIGRKDIIIVAVLVNVALLSLVFATSTHSTVLPSPASPLDGVAHRQAVECSASDTRLVPVDEIDAILQEMAREGSIREQRLPTSPVAAPLPSGGVREIVVKKGDSLDKVARAHRVTVDELVSWNHLGTAKLQIGQKLKIEGSGSSTAEYYVMKSGDNPWTIAHRFNMDFEELLVLNSLDEEKARNLKIGQKIRIR